MRKHNKARLALAVAGALAGMSSAHALEFTAGTWKLNIGGSVNAFYTNTSCDQTGQTAPVIVATLPVCGLQNEDFTGIQNGLLPGYLNFSAETQAKGLDLKAVVGLWPGTSAANGINNTGTTPDVRTVYVQFGSKNWGSFKLGRDIGLFQQNAILNDMTLLSVGTGAGFQGAINTTLGMIGSGYIYSEFQPQVTYTTPTWNGFNASLGAFQPRNTSGVGGLSINNGGKFDQPGYQYLMQHEYKGSFTSKLWHSGAHQEAEQAFLGNGTPGGAATPFLIGTKVKGDGYEVGGKLGYMGFEGMVAYFWGQGLGEAIQFVNGHDAAGNKRDSDGFLAQITWKIPNTDVQLGFSYGESNLDATAIDTLTLPNLVNQTKSYVIQGKYDLMPGLSLIAEYTDSQQEANGVAGLCTAADPAFAVGCEQKAKTFAVGAIVFF